MSKKTIITILLAPDSQILKRSLYGENIKKE